MRNFEDLFNEDIDLGSIISKETQERTKSALDGFFDPEIQERRNEVLEPVEVREKNQEKPYDAEANARSLVYGLNAIDTLIFTTIGAHKAKKKIGGKEGLKEMRIVEAKKKQGKELTEKEKEIYASSLAYVSELDKLADDYVPTDKQRQVLIDMAIPACEATQLQMGPWVGFLIVYASQTVEKTSKLILS